MKKNCSLELLPCELKMLKWIGLKDLKIKWTNIQNIRARDDQKEKKPERKHKETAKKQQRNHKETAKTLQRKGQIDQK